MATNQLRGVVETLRRAALPQEGAGLTDGQLLERYVRSREEAAFAALVRRHGPMVWGVCRWVLRNPHDAEDAFQATFLVLVRKAAAVVPREAVGNWLYGVARQTALYARATAARRRGREKQVTAIPEPACEPQDRRNDVQALLDQELARLPDKYRAVIVLCDLQGKTRKEAARHFHLPEGTVATRLATARAMLARRLARQGLAVSDGALAAALAPQGASAGVPPAVVSTTIQAASLFAAGQATATGVLPGRAVALAEGVLKTMLLTKLKLATAVLLAVAFLGTGAAALTQQVPADPPAPQPVQEKKDGAPESSHVSGLVKAVDFTKHTVTVAHQGGKDTFPVAKDATIRIDGRPGNLVGLPTGVVVTLGLLADHRTVRSIQAESPQVAGVVKAVDAAKSTVNIEDRGAEKSFTVARDARVEIDGKPRTLAELPAGARVTLGRVDPKTADSIRAEGPEVVDGLVRAVDAEKNSLTFAYKHQPSEPEKTVAVARDAPVTIDGQPGQLARLPRGALVHLVLSVDQKTVRRIEASGDWWQGVLVKAVDADKNTVTFSESDKQPAEVAGKTLPLAKGATLVIDGQPGQLAGLPPGAWVTLHLSADSRAVASLEASGPGYQGVLVKAVDAAKGTITFDEKQNDRQSAELLGKTFPVAKGAPIVIDGQPGKLTGVPAGALVSLVLFVDQKTVRSLAADGGSYSGVVKAVDAEKRTITIEVINSGGQKTFPVAKDAAIAIDGQPGELAAVPKEAGISLLLSVDKTVRRIEARGP
jgi:RNA polymerase sigma factor (sigma-70 family)